MGANLPDRLNARELSSPTVPARAAGGTSATCCFQRVQRYVARFESARIGFPLRGIDQEYGGVVTRKVDDGAAAGADVQEPVIRLGRE